MAKAKTTSLAHTAKPWKLTEGGRIRSEQAIGKWDDDICQMPFSSLEEAKEMGSAQLANAHLIAASPTMLEALLFVAPYLRDHIQYDNGEISGEADALKKIEEAIAAANGKI